MTTSWEEQQVITRLKHGDISGLEFLVKRYQVEAVYAAYLIVRDYKQAEDIVQNAFLQAAKKIHQFDNRRTFRAWFIRSVVNAAIKVDKQQKRFISLDANENEEIDPIINWLLDPQPGPDIILESKETCQLVWKALNSLSPEQRATIVMRHFLEMNESDMSEEFGRPLTTIRWWLRSARNRLRELLRPQWKADHPREDDRET